MILRRFGNKQNIAKDIIKYFPDHKIYIEPFFGAGGMFFNKPKAKYNYLNDIDNDIINLFNLITTKKQDLLDFIYLIPEDRNLFNYWKNNKETEPIRMAARFLVLSNFALYGAEGSFRIGNSSDKRSMETNLDKTYDFIVNGCFSTKFLNFDFRNVLKNISFNQDGRNDEEKAFIYSDSPYLKTANNYKNETKWTEKDAIDCMDITFNSGIKGAMSEFDNEFILSQAKERKLNIIYIGERRNLKNKRTEILITNYQKERTLFD